MTAILRPLVTAHHLVTVLVTAALSVGLTVALTLSLTNTKSGAGVTHPARTDSTLCHNFANATPGSPAAFRLADEIADEGSC